MFRLFLARLQDQLPRARGRVADALNVMGCARDEGRIKVYCDRTTHSDVYWIEKALLSKSRGHPFSLLYLTRARTHNRYTPY